LRLVLSLPQAVLGIATKPVALVSGVDQLLTQLGHVAARALALLDTAEPVAARVSAVVDDAEAVAARVSTIAARAEELTAGVDGLVARADLITGKADAATDAASASIAALEPLVDAASRIDPQALVALVETLPAVLEKLAAQVDNLDRTVADVGALLQGIPGAARLAKRGLTAR
jgi:uncharacterized protein YoxC